MARLIFVLIFIIFFNFATNDGGPESNQVTTKQKVEDLFEKPVRVEIEKTGEAILSMDEPDNESAGKSQETTEDKELNSSPEREGKKTAKSLFSKSLWERVGQLGCKKLFRLYRKCKIVCFDFGLIQAKERISPETNDTLFLLYRTV